MLLANAMAWKLTVHYLGLLCSESYPELSGITLDKQGLVNMIQNLISQGVLISKWMSSAGDFKSFASVVLFLFFIFNDSVSSIQTHHNLIQLAIFAHLMLLSFMWYTVAYAIVGVHAFKSHLAARCEHTSSSCIKLSWVHV